MIAGATVPTPLLLLATATRWYGTARMPGNLARAGFDVTLLAPPGSFAERSRYVSRVAHLPADANARQWAEAFAAAVAATSPRIVVACDDTTFRLLQLFVREPPPGMAPARHLALASLIVDSIGDPAFYRTSVDKTRLPAAAAALGIRVPPFSVVRNVAGAREFAAIHGFPVVVKRGNSTAGDAVAICADDRTLARAFADLARADPLRLDDASDGTLLLQAHVPGRIRYRNVLAWRGRDVAGFAVDRVLAQVEPKGPAAVIRWRRCDQLADIAQRLSRGFGMSGPYAIECLVHQTTGEAYLLEINRRLSPGMHVGEAIGVDLAVALYDAMHGNPLRTRADVGATEEGTHVHFPQEWLRDPASPYLDSHPVDVPWDDPTLFAALVAARGAE